MVLDFIFNIFASIVKSVFGILPTVPAIDSSISNAGTWITTNVSDLISVIHLIYGRTLFNVIMLTVLVLLNFEWVYHTILWIIKKIPIINIK